MTTIQTARYDIAHTQACKNALQVQNACNPLAVIAQWAQDMRALFEADPSAGNQFPRTHPASILYLDKVADMLGRPSHTEFNQAFDACTLDRAVLPGNMIAPTTNH